MGKVNFRAGIMLVETGKTLSAVKLYSEIEKVISNDKEVAERFNVFSVNIASILKI